MFAKAYSIATQFTHPIVISSQKFNGDCNAGIGSFVIINDEGWFVTTFHIIAQLQALRDSYDKYNNSVQERAQIQNDPALKNHERIRRLNSSKIAPDLITNFSTWLGAPNLTIGPVYSIPQVDLAVGRLLNFDRSQVKIYPKFKDPAKPMEIGTSLCKLGFPFHTIKPTFDPATGFNLPDGALPIPFFPLEGIYTRTVFVEAAGSALNLGPNPLPLMYIETSSPGLPGQSGGPTFDIHGTIWAIQSQTQHLKLGFGINENAPTKELEHLKNQYLNVGWGIHSQTITEFLKRNGIVFTLSDY